MTEEAKPTPQVEIVEPEPAPEKPTPESLQESGLSAQEMEAAAKHGLVEAKPEEKKDAPKPEAKPEAKTPEPEKPEQRKGTRNWESDDLPDDFDKYTPNEKGLYWAQKKEKARRQRLQIERDQASIKLKAAEKELETLKAGAKPPEKREDGDPLDVLLDGKDKPKPEEKPLTRADLERIEQEKAEKAEKEATARKERAAMLGKRLDEFQADAKAKFEDFDAVTDLAQEIIEKGAAVFGADSDRAELAAMKAQKALYSIANALDWPEGQKTPAELVYELGRLHPKYKKDAGPAEKPPENGDQRDPEKVKRMLDNAERRSSASVGGGTGGRRLVSEDELTLEQAAKLSDDEFGKLSPATRRRLLSQ